MFTEALVYIWPAGMTLTRIFHGYQGQ